ncbi:MAG: ABC transporter permease subunit, partial [Chromatiales bacterium]|nr:ABC transporter permease subunit [Chromatiales bacterium]
RRELLSLFLSPLAWAVMAIVQGLMAYVFLRLLQGFSDAQGKLQGLPGAPGITRLVAMPLFEVAAFVLVLVIPLITMRLIAEERRTGSIELLLSAPLTSTQIVLGKFVGAYEFVLCLLVLIVAMPTSLALGATLDVGQMFAGSLALVILSATFTSTGLYMSTLTAQPFMAAVSTFGLLLFAWLIDAGVEPDGVLAYLSVLNHFRGLLRGVIDSRDLAYFALINIALITLAVRRFNAGRTPL